MHDHFSFPKGSLVEVSSVEDGLAGARFPGIVVRPASKRLSRGALVEYKTLVVAEGSSDPLLETVEVSMLRPLPPEEARESFELYEVVDAFHEDGWWTGVINGVLGQFRYCVLFQNPSDQIQVRASQLRPHLDWIEGCWVRPERKRMEDFIFSIGAAVEVKPFEGSSDDAWLPANVLRKNGNSSIVVKYQSLGDNDVDGCQEKTVDLHQTRPCPPIIRNPNFNLLDKVDAFYDSGWHSGVITKVLPGYRYLVYFKKKNSEKELSHYEIRPHMEWKDGKWFIREALLSTSNTWDQVRHGCRNGLENEMFIHNGSSSIEGNDLKEETFPLISSRKKKRSQMKHSCKKKSPPQANTSSKMKLLPAANHDVTHSWPSKTVKKGNAAEVPSSVTACELKILPIRTSPEGKPCGLPNTSTSNSSNHSSKKSTVGSHPSSIDESPLEKKKTECKQEIDGEPDSEGKSLSKKRGRPPKSPVNSPQDSATGNKSNAVEDCTERRAKKERIVKEDALPAILGLACQRTATPRQRMAIPQKDLSKKSVKLRSVQLCQPKIPVRRKNNESDSEHNGQLSNSTKRGRGRPKTKTRGQELKRGSLNISPTYGSAPERTVSQVNEMKDLGDETAVAGPTVTDMPNENQSLHLVKESPLQKRVAGTTVNDPNESQSLCFVKKSPLWEAIEAMDAFQQLPQNPHFCPLNECNEELREGFAIGNMLAFACVVEKASKLQFEDPKSSFDSMIDALSELEAHGFDVKPVQNHIHELFSFKMKSEQLFERSKGIKSQLAGLCEKGAKTDEEVDEIERQMKELEEKRSLALELKAAQDSDIDSLQSDLEVIDEAIHRNLVEFAILAAPWQSL